MVKLLFGWKDAPSRTAQECEDHYRSTHMPLAREAYRQADGFRSLIYNRVRSYKVNDYNSPTAREAEAPMDAFIELYFESMEQLQAALGHPVLATMFVDHANFMDTDIPANVSIYEVDEEVILERAGVVISAMAIVTPVSTTLAAQFSDPTAVAVPWEQASRALDEAQLFWISTVRADGRPHVTPVVALWAQGAVWFSTGATEQKFANIRAHPQVVLTTGCNGWEGGLDVVVEGEAVQVTDDAVLGPVAAAFGAKWDGRWEWIARDGYFRGPDGEGEAAAFAVVPTRVFAHAKGDPFGATTYRFA